MDCMATTIRMPLCCKISGDLLMASRAADVLLHVWRDSLSFAAMRGSMLEVIRQDYIRTARAKGLSEKIVVYKHALRNSMIPIVTIVGRHSSSASLVGRSYWKRSLRFPGSGFLSLMRSRRGIIRSLSRLGLYASAVLTLAGILLSDILIFRGRSADRIY